MIIPSFHESYSEMDRMEQCPHVPPRPPPPPRATLPINECQLLVSRRPNSPTRFPMTVHHSMKRYAERFFPSIYIFFWHLTRITHPVLHPYWPTLPFPVVICSFASSLRSRRTLKRLLSNVGEMHGRHWYVCVCVFIAPDARRLNFDHFSPLCQWENAWYIVWLINYLGVLLAAAAPDTVCLVSNQTARKIPKPDISNFRSIMPEWEWLQPVTSYLQGYVEVYCVLIKVIYWRERGGDGA